MKSIKEKVAEAKKRRALALESKKPNPNTKIRIYA
jgi:hypothetical protein